MVRIAVGDAMEALVVRLASDRFVMIGVERNAQALACGVAQFPEIGRVGSGVAARQSG